MRGREIATSRQVTHLARLVDDLLDVSRIGAGQDRAAPGDRRTWPRSSSDAVRERGRSSIERQLELTALAASRESLVVEADPTRLEQVLVNLLDERREVHGTRAATSTSPPRPGGVDARPPRFATRASASRREMLPRIFDLFVQAERRLDRSVGGLGVGLTLVQKLVEMHGGTVEARSPGPGKGSEFIVRLPCVPARAVPAPGWAADYRREKRVPLRVLIADDNPEAADALGMLLEMDGDEVRVAYDGLSVLREAEAFRPNVVLLDIGMPGLDGHEVARRLRASESTKDFRLIAISGWGTPEDRKLSYDAGFDHHLVKPFDLGALDSLLRSFGAALPRREAT